MTTTLPPQVQPAYGTLRLVQVHFDDLDAMGIVHNAKFAVLLERAISAYWREHGWSFDPATTRFPDDLMLAVRSFSITYHSPIPAVSEVAVNLWIEQFGRTSLTYHFRVTSADGEVVHAEGSRTQVKIDPQSRRPAPISPELRKAAADLIRSE